jgi:hypothetical protein
MALHRYTKKEKQEAAALYFTCNSFAEVEKQSGGRFKARTVKMWETDDEDFLTAYEACATMGGKELIGKMRKFVDKSLSMATDQLDDPDVDIKFRDLVLAAGIIHDKRQVMEGKVTTRSGSGEGMASMLEEAERQLAIKAEKRTKEAAKAAEKSDKVVKIAHSRFS